MQLTAERLRELLVYDPDNGSFVWKKSTSNRAMIGAAIKCRDRHSYVIVRLDGRLYLAHRLAFLYMNGRLPEHDVDHVNGDRADNRWANLREATRQENMRNKPARASKSGVRGVEQIPSGKWRASITVSRRQLHLGCFDSIDEAKNAYEQAALKYFGEFVHQVYRKEIQLGSESKF